MTDAMRKRIIAELTEALELESIPEGAIRFKEIQMLETLGGRSKESIRDWLNNKIESGEWRKVRRGQSVYYWPVEKKKDQP